MAKRLFDTEAASLVVVGDALKFIEEIRRLRPNVELIDVADLEP